MGIILWKEVITKFIAEIYRKCMEERRKMLGDQHHFTLQSMNNLALCCQHLREYSESEVLLKHCVSANRERYGERYSETIIAMNNLALLYHHQAREVGFIGDIAFDRLQQALTLYEQCLQLKKDGGRRFFKTLGPPLRGRVPRILEE
jgi:tetratricopeptide (TPR) repeat protein